MLKHFIEFFKKNFELWVLGPQTSLRTRAQNSLTYKSKESSIINTIYSLSSFNRYQHKVNLDSSITPFVPPPLPQVGYFKANPRHDVISSINTSLLSL